MQRGVKDLNKEKNSDIRIVVEKPAYTLYALLARFIALDYVRKMRRLLSIRSNHTSTITMVKVRIFEATGKTALQRAMDLEAFIANKAHKVISVADNGSAYTLVYIEKGSVRNYNTTDDDCDWDEENPTLIAT